jgi:hypothetical protein
MSSDAPEYILAASRILGHSLAEDNTQSLRAILDVGRWRKTGRTYERLQAKLEAEAPEAFFDEVSLTP